MREAKTISKLLSAVTIASWTASIGRVRLVRDDSVDEFALARQIWASMEGSGPTIEIAPGDRSNIAGLGYALRELVLYNQATGTVEVVAGVYRFLEAADWPETEFWEKDEVLADIGYHLSVMYRACGDHPNMRFWEDQAVAATLRSEPSATYLRNRHTNTGSRADDIFLGRAPIVLCVCRQLERDRNYRPIAAAELAATIFEAVSTSCRVPGEERSYLLGDIALSAAVSSCHLGQFQSASDWLGRARSLFHNTSYPAALLTNADVAHLIMQHIQYKWDDVLNNANAVLKRAEAFQMARNALSVRLLIASCLKELGRSKEALRRYTQLALENVSDAVFRAVILIGLADTQSVVGEIDAALVSCQKALVAAKEADSPISWGFLHGVMGQILRDNGRPIEALAQFERAIEGYAVGGMVQLQCYTMVITAELMLAVGRQADGIKYLLSALILLRETRVDREITAAIELLRQGMAGESVPPRQVVGNLRNALGRVLNIRPVK